MIFQRIKTILCKEWGKSPVEVQAMIDREEILLSDVFELIVYKMATDPNGGNIPSYIFREDVIQRKKVQESVSQLLKLREIQKDENEILKIDKALEDIRKNPRKVRIK